MNQHIKYHVGSMVKIIDCGYLYTTFQLAADEMELSRYIKISECENMHGKIVGRMIHPDIEGLMLYGIHIEEIDRDIIAEEYGIESIGEVINLPDDLFVV